MSVATFDVLEVLHAQGQLRRWGAPPAPNPPVHEVVVELEAAVGVGRDVSDAVLALHRATAEALERRTFVRELDASTLTRACVGEISERSINLRHLAGYSDAQRASDPALAWTPSTVLAWVPAESLVDGARRMVPAQLISGARCLDAEPCLRPRLSTGYAAHPERTRARLHGALEVIERDAFMLTWLTKVPPAHLDLATAGPAATEVLQRLERYGFAVNVFRLPTDVPVTAVCAVVADRFGERAVSAAADIVTDGAIVRAMLGAVGAWAWAKRLAARTAVPTLPLTSLPARVVWWARPEHAELLAWLAAGPREAIEAAPTSALTADAVLAAIAEALGRAEEDLLVVERGTPEDARTPGHYVAACLIPGYHPLHADDRRPALGSARLAARLRDVGGCRPNLRLPHPLG